MNEILASGMSLLASLFNGSIGWAIVVLALTVRFALLPLTLHLSRRMHSNQQKIKALQPQVDAIRERLSSNPQQAFAAVSALYKQNGAHLIDRFSIFGAVAQWPIFLLLYKAISNAASGSGPFLWIRSLASPDAALTALVLALTAVAAFYAPSTAGHTATLMIFVQVVVTAFIIWKLSAGVALYWAASASVGVVQSGILRAERRRRVAMAKAQ